MHSLQFHSDFQGEMNGCGKDTGVMHACVGGSVRVNTCMLADVAMQAQKYSFCFILQPIAFLQYVCSYTCAVTFLVPSDVTSLTSFRVLSL